jgi:hypothetical protein
MPWHSLVIALIPSLASCVLLVRYWGDLRGSRLVFAFAIALSVAQGRPEIQEVYTLHGTSASGLYAHGLPFFAVLYLIFGRYDLPSALLAWAGTYLCLMVTDLSFNYFNWRTGAYDWELLLFGIGGAGWYDGLVWQPLGATAITAFVRSRLERGYVFQSMIGRRRFLKESRD